MNFHQNEFEKYSKEDIEDFKQILKNSFNFKSEKQIREVILKRFGRLDDFGIVLLLKELNKEEIQKGSNKKRKLKMMIPLSWSEGRQQSGYKKFTFFIIDHFLKMDCYLIYIPEKTMVPKHQDLVDKNYKHFRLNIILKNCSEGGLFLAKLPFLNLFNRIHFFRPDINEHQLTTIEKGNIIMLSFGFLTKKKIINIKDFNHSCFLSLKEFKLTEYLFGNQNQGFVTKEIKSITKKKVKNLNHREAMNCGYDNQENFQNKILEMYPHLTSESIVFINNFY